VQVSGSLTGPVLRYSCGVLNLHQETLTKLDRKTRKLLAIHGHYHNKADVDSWYVHRKRGRKGAGTIRRSSIYETDGICAKQGRTINTNCQNAPTFTLMVKI